MSALLSLEVDSSRILIGQIQTDIRSAINTRFKGKQSLFVAVVVRQTKISKRTLFRILGGEVTPTISTIFSLYSVIFNCSVDEVFAYLPPIVSLHVEKVTSKVSKLVDLSDLFSSDSNTFELYFRTMEGKVLSRDFVIKKFGLNGLASLNKLLEMKIVARSGDNYVCGSTRAFWSPRFVVTVNRILVSCYASVEALAEDSGRSASFFSVSTFREEDLSSVSDLIHEFYDKLSALSKKSKDSVEKGDPVVELAMTYLHVPFSE